MNDKQLKAAKAEAIVGKMLVSLGWDVRKHSGTGCDFIVTCGWGKPMNVEVKSLTTHGGPHYSTARDTEGLNLEGVRPQVSMPLTRNNGLYYKDCVDFLIGVDVETEQCYCYSKDQLREFGIKKSFRVDKYPPCEFPMSPKLLKKEEKAVEGDGPLSIIEKAPKRNKIVNRRTAARGSKIRRRQNTSRSR